MINGDRIRFAQQLAMLGAAFGRPIDEHTVEAFWRALIDLDIDELAAAADVWLRTGRNFPRPVELRELTGASREEEALEAWEDVLRLAANSRAARHDSPLVEDVVRQLGGWLALGQQSPDQLTVWTRKEFLALYAAGAPRAEAHEQLVAGSAAAELIGGLAGKKALPPARGRR